ncbi:uncharacterized protein LOC115453129 isoform X1 [Manduca sexta]|nr:uncharacterized protein LOC115453129 isoform X1 [Manduca sexta]
MPHQKERFEPMLFNYETTNRTDLKDGEIKPIIRTKYKSKPVCVGIRPPPLKYIHTFTNWKKPSVPIDLYLKPKEIVRTNPHHIQEKYECLPDLEKDQVRKTRPRLVMTPAISLDDIDDDGVRNMLLNEVYDTTAKRSMRQGVELHSGGLDAPRPKIPAPPDPISIPKFQVPYVSPEWRIDSVTWDGRQLRTYTDPTKEFWLARQSTCEECKRTAARNAYKKMKLH